MVIQDWARAFPLVLLTAVWGVIPLGNLCLPSKRRSPIRKRDVSRRSATPWKVQWRAIRRRTFKCIRHPCFTLICKASSRHGHILWAAIDSLCSTSMGSSRTFNTLACLLPSSNETRWPLGNRQVIDDYGAEGWLGWKKCIGDFLNDKPEDSKVTFVHINADSPALHQTAIVKQ